MSVTLIAVLKIKPEMVTESKSFMKEIIPDTRAFDGCQGIQIYFDTEKEGDMVLIEEWDSVEHYERYHAWRIESGTLQKLRDMMEGPPERKFLENTGI